MADGPISYNSNELNVLKSLQAYNDIRNPDADANQKTYMNNIMDEIKDKSIITLDPYDYHEVIYADDVGLKMSALRMSKIPNILAQLDGKLGDCVIKEMNGYMSPNIPCVFIGNISYGFMNNVCTNAFKSSKSDHLILSPTHNKPYILAYDESKYVFTLCSDVYQHTIAPMTAIPPGRFKIIIECKDKHGLPTV